jgi:hypothetical protein
MGDLETLGLFFGYPSRALRSMQTKILMRLVKHLLSELRMVVQFSRGHVV